MTAVREPAVSTALTFRGPGEPDHLDPTAPYTVRTGQLLGLLTRGLYGYRAGDAEPVPDLADGDPQLDSDRRSYRYRLRRNVFWDAQGARELVAADLVRGLKRVAHPTAAAGRGYLTGAILGLREYCAAYDEAFTGRYPTAPDFAQFHVANDVAGLRAPDPYTLEITLTEPANDLPHLLASALAAAAPREFDYYQPDSHELVRNAPSAGPYRIARARSRGPELVLEPNPRWRPEADPVRVRLVDEIRVRADAGADAAWAFGTTSWAATPAGHPERYRLGHYLIVNHRRPGPVQDPVLRRAVSLAADRAALRDAVYRVPGTSALALHGVLAPGSPGYAPDPADRAGGDPGQARELVASLPGPALTLAVPDTELDRQVADVLGVSLRRAGILLAIRPVPADRFATVLRAGAQPWDLALSPGHLPAWYGNNGRTAVQPLLCTGGAANHGGYRDPGLDRLVYEALRAPDLPAAADRWRLVDAAVRRDLPVVPLLAHSCGPCAATDLAPRLRWWAS